MKHSDLVSFVPSLIAWPRRSGVRRLQNDSCSQNKNSTVCTYPPNFADPSQWHMYVCIYIYERERESNDSTISSVCPVFSLLPSRSYKYVSSPSLAFEGQIIASKLSNKKKLIVSGLVVSQSWATCCMAQSETCKRRSCISFEPNGGRKNVQMVRLSRLAQDKSGLSA